ncbi:MAG: hypothetical protein ABIB04_03790 [Patescibacteria group bacterium]
MKHFNICSALIFSILAGIAPLSTNAYTLDNTLVKNASSSAVYYVNSDKRYAFPSEKIFFNWYDNFSDVKQISDAELASLPLAGNITYRPGSTLVKITTDPKVYAISRYGVLHWVMNEDLAKSFYGEKWNQKIMDVPDEFFTNYIVDADLVAANQFNANEEKALAGKPSDNIRPAAFTPSSLPQPIQTTAIPKISVSLSSNQAVMNQTVYVYASVTDNVSPITKITIYSEDTSTALATCLNTITCEYQFMVQNSPQQRKFYAEAMDDQGNVLNVPVENRPLLTVSQSSNLVQMQITLSSVVTGSSVQMTSDASMIQTITSHRIYALIPGEKYPVLWKDCGASTSCTDKTPFYRQTYLFSQVDANGQTYQSVPVQITTTGETPKPTITLISKPTPSQIEISIKPPTGEMIGLTSLVEGTTIEDSALAICEADCSLTLQISKPTDLTAFTYVGGKYEKSNTLNAAP